MSHKMDEQQLKRIIEKWHKTWREERTSELEALYNDLVDVIAKHKAHYTTVITALNLLLSHVLAQQRKQLLGEGKTDAV
ncbi:MAG: hypothetical protein QXJ31_05205 [Candidatus Bathyarchaeia archaeon]